MSERFTQVQLLQAYYQMKSERDQEGACACEAAAYFSEQLKKYVKDPAIRVSGPAAGTISPFPNTYKINIEVTYNDPVIFDIDDALGKINGASCERVGMDKNGDGIYKLKFDVSTIPGFEACPVKVYEGKINITEAP